MTNKYYRLLNKEERALLSLPLLLGKVIDGSVFRKVRGRKENLHYKTDGYESFLFYKNVCPILQPEKIDKLRVNEE